MGMPSGQLKDAGLKVSLKGELEKQRAAQENGCHQLAF